MLFRSMEVDDLKRIGMFFGIFATLFLLACSSVTVIEVRVFSAGSRKRISAATQLFLVNSETGVRGALHRVKGGKHLFSLNNYRLGHTAKIHYLQLEVTAAGYQKFSGSYTNLQFLERNTRSPYQRFLDVYLHKLAAVH